MKIVKLTEEHYIQVDDSEIKIGDIVSEKLLTGGYELFEIHTLNDIDKSTQKKVTDSTQPLEEDITYRGITKKPVLSHFKIKPLSLSEVEEVVYGYSVEKMANDEYPIERGGSMWMPSKYDLSQNDKQEGYIKGFKAHQELVKDKLFTVDDMMEAFTRGYIDGIERTEDITYYADKFHKSLLPKTEWEVEFVNGELKLKS
jgi:hypothetical protein